MSEYSNNFMTWMHIWHGLKWIVPKPDSDDYEEMRARNEDTEAIYEVNLEFVERFRQLMSMVYGDNKF